MLKDQVRYRCTECEEETVLRVPKGRDWEEFVEDEECPECGAMCLEVTEEE